MKHESFDEIDSMSREITALAVAVHAIAENNSLTPMQLRVAQTRIARMIAERSDGVRGVLCGSSASGGGE